MKTTLATLAKKIDQCLPQPLSEMHQITPQWWEHFYSYYCLCGTVGHSLVRQSQRSQLRQKNEVCYLQQHGGWPGAGSPSTQGQGDLKTHNYSYWKDLASYRGWHIPERIYFKIMFHTLHVQKWRIRRTPGQIIWHYEIILNKVV